MITRPSFTPPGDPGRLTIRLLSFKPTNPRDRSAVAIFSLPYARSASANPGIDFFMKGAVASGGHPRSRTGLLAKGKKTRNPKKHTNRLIISRRKK